ncbi:MAG: transporter substrate-binding domain-containing protein, partial [bacterium]
MDKEAVIRSAAEVDYPPFSIVDENDRADGFSIELSPDRPIVIGGDHNYPPFEFLDKDGRPAGYNVDLVQAVADAAGLDVHIRLGSWPEITRALKHGEIDVLQGMFYSPERNETFDFSPAHHINHYVAVVRRESGPPPTDVAGLAGKQLVVQRGDIMHEFSRKHDLTDQLTLVDAQEDALLDVAEGRSDCALVARMTAFYWIEHEGWDNLVVGRTPLLSPEYCFAVSQDHQALLAEFSEGLAAVKASGEYRRIQQKWLGVYDERTFGWRDAVKYVVWIAGPLLLVALLALLLLASCQNLMDSSDSDGSSESAPETYRVLYEANGATSGEVPTDSTEYVSAETATVLDNTGALAKDGYRLAGWNTAADGSGDGYTAGGSVTIGGTDVTLYAHWVALGEYSVSYNANGADEGTVPSTQTKTEEVDLTLAGNSEGLAKTGHTFAGWNTADDASGTAYTESATYSEDA